MPDEILVSQENSPIPPQTAALAPTREELSALKPVERLGFSLTHRMNQGTWKRFWTFCQRHIGSLWIYLATYNLMNVFGIENVENSDVERPLLLVANHRSYFDLYTVSSVLFRRTRRPVTLFFPVRAKFFYTSPLGWFVNLVMGWWAMYPPFFYKNEQREFDKFSLRRLIQLCSIAPSNSRGNVIGLHPEGKRNKDPNPYSFLPAQPGVGKIVMAARPQVIPVFIAGLGNDLPKQILGNWTGGEKVRMYFGEPVDLSEFYEKRDALRTHKEIADFLMAKIAELAEKDKERSAK
ncbi:MAG TPA: lysophospholipid acyltransferase family protein [Pyrinomonadaceae bacterium]|jgi:1-acyl-sn-glycerol-3-phosphate acyltransferase|nr:lysophospholipid acyltransferase family protein [Pyrinomonadaceae bacterium]